MEQSKTVTERIRPLGNQVLVQPEQAKDRRTSSGLYVPSNAKERGIRARVLAVGPGEYLQNGQLIPPALSLGDLVIVSEYNDLLSTGSQCVGDNVLPVQLVNAKDVRAVVEVVEEPATAAEEIAA